MHSAHETARYAWQSLREEWEEAREHWNDSTTEHFLSHYWAPLEQETEALQRALEHLNAVLEAALNAAY
jgi:uncharacterized protein YukE